MSNKIKFTTITDVDSADVTDAHDIKRALEDNLAPAVLRELAGLLRPFAPQRTASF